MSWLGRIYMARIPDPDGREIDHDHPVMVFRGPDVAGNLYVIAISTKFDRPVGRFMLECPWSAAGHEDTGLNQPCVLKCSWVVPLNVRNLKDFVGMMPSTIAERAIEYALTARAERDERPSA